MKSVTSSVIAASLMLMSTQAAAAVVIDSAPGSAAETMSVVSAGMPSGAEQPNAVGKIGTIVGDAVFSPMAMLPAPSDWVLLLAGFGVIGYAMRSGKRGRISFN